MTKIVVNKCFGGFGLSQRACMKYAQLAGFKLYALKSTDFRKGTYIPANAADDDLFVSYSTKPLLKDGTIHDGGAYWSYRDIERTDPILVDIVEDMGEEADRRFAQLHVVEIPDDVKYEIDEYDGMESIHEVHRSW